MGFDWEEFCGVGTHLLKKSSEEAYKRSGIGRLYYACFGKSKQYYEVSFRRVLPSKEGHKILIDELEKSIFKEERDLGKALHNLRKLRNHADYYEWDMQRNAVSSSKMNAKEVFNLLNYLNQYPVR